MLEYLSQFERLFGPLRLFRYLTFRCALAFVIALTVGFVVGPKLIAYLRRFKLSQTLRNADEVRELASLHANKVGTPTMGGWMTFVAVVVATLLCAKLNLYVGVALLVYTVLTLIGFYDDYLKVTKKNAKGFKGAYKLVLQACLVLVVLWLLLGINVDTHIRISALWVPFLKVPLIKWVPPAVLFIYLFLVLAGSSNAINLTDGIDGLAIGCTVTVALVYAILSYVAGNAMIADYLSVAYMPGAGELAVICMAVIGGGLAFLWFNAHPAEVFMGDTGSLALGGLIGIIAFMTQQSLTLVIVGAVFVAEALSVILQVASFKLCGRRIFRMAPLHHHFELGGLKEIKVAIRFWIISLICAIAGLCTLKLR